MELRYFKIRFSQKQKEEAGNNYLINRALGWLPPGEFSPKGNYSWGLIFDNETFNAPEVQNWLKKYNRPYYFEYYDEDESILSSKKYHPI